MLFRSTLLFRNGLSITNASAVQLFGQISTYGAPATLGDHDTTVYLRSGSAKLDTTAGNAWPNGGTITLGGPVEGVSGGENITLTAGVLGDVLLVGNVGATQRVGNVEITVARNVVAQAIRAMRLLQTMGTGTTTLNGTVNTTSATGVDIDRKSTRLNSSH